MKKFFLIVTVSILLLLSTELIFAEDLNKVSINGYLKTNNLFRIKNGSIDSNLNTLGIKFEGSTDKYHYFSEITFSYFGKTNFTSDDINELTNLQTLTPVELNLKEGYLDLYSFLFPFLDVRVGKQIIVWGTADKINPTSNICPLDLSNILDFGNKLGVNALQLNFYVGDITLSTTYIPSFTPSLLPSNFLEMSGQNSVSNITLDVPSQKLGLTSQAAAKIDIPISTFDFSISYYYGRYNIPNAKKVFMITDDLLNPTYFNIESTTMFFPKLQVIGGDFSGSLFNLGVWGEAGYFIPQKYSLNTYVHTSTTPYMQFSSDNKVDDPYFRYVLGFDYTFKNGIYINTQFTHGFDNEITKDSINDYLITRLEKSFFNDKLKISPITFLLTTGDWDNVKNNYGFAYIPEIYYYPIDNIEIEIGCYLLEGKGDNMISNIENKDTLFLKAKVSF